MATLNLDATAVMGVGAMVMLLLRQQGDIMGTVGMPCSGAMATEGLGAMVTVPMRAVMSGAGAMATTVRSPSEVTIIIGTWAAPLLPWKRGERGPPPHLLLGPIPTDAYEGWVRPFQCGGSQNGI